MKKLNILFEDKHFLIVEKEAGQLSQADKNGSESIYSLAKDYLIEKSFNKSPYLAMNQRLDRAVSGIILMTKTKHATKHILKHPIDKYYLAIVEGAFDEKEGQMQDYLLKNQEENYSYLSTKSNEKAKLAKLEYKVINMKVDSKVLSMLEIKLLTGRHHQIRVQLSSKKHPIIGDRKYNGDLSFSKIALSAYKISFRDLKKAENNVFTLDLMDKYPFDIFCK